MQDPKKPGDKEACATLLNALSEADIKQLTDYAIRRLLGLGRSPDTAEDHVQNSLLAVLYWTQGQPDGRQPRVQDLETKEAFMYYMQGIVKSRISSETKSIRLRPKKVRIEEGATDDAQGELEQTVTLVAPLPTASEEVEWNDVRQQLFARLHARIPTRLKATLSQWESNHDMTRIPPVNNARKYSIQLRKLAQEILKELDIN